MPAPYCCRSSRPRLIWFQTCTHKLSPSNCIISPKPLTTKQRPDVQALAQAIRETTEAEIDELARLLLDTDDAHLFGDNEFKIRALAHKIAEGDRAAPGAKKTTTRKRAKTPREIGSSPVACFAGL